VVSSIIEALHTRAVRPGMLLERWSTGLPLRPRTQPADTFPHLLTKQPSQSKHHDSSWLAAPVHSMKSSRLCSKAGNSPIVARLDALNYRNWLVADGELSAVALLILYRVSVTRSKVERAVQHGRSVRKPARLFVTKAGSCDPR
jgi:hypothetical protein